MDELEYNFGRKCKGASKRDIRNITYVVVAAYPDYQIPGTFNDLAEVHKDAAAFTPLSNLTAQKFTPEELDKYCKTLLLTNNVSSQALNTYLDVYAKYGSIEQELKAAGTTLDARISSGSSR